MPWRDVSPLFPEVEQAAGISSSLARRPLGSGAPADVLAPPSASATSSTCAAYRCDDPISSRLTGQCAVHSERWLNDLREYTDDIGRGSFDA
jgi:hypothetical protein